MTDDTINDFLTYWTTEDGMSENWTRFLTPTCFNCAIQGKSGDTLIVKRSETKTKALGGPRALTAECTGCGRIFYRQPNKEESSLA